MAQLSIGERRQLETLFDMGGGYVLDFSNRTFEEFVADSVGIEVYDDKYHHGSGSKANRLRGFWKLESNELVGKLIRDLVEYAEFVNKDIDTDLANACRAIADRLQAAPKTPASPPTRPQSQPTGTTEAETGQRIRVFLSYSWDNESHKDWVREFADALASNGIDIILDQYDLRIGDDRFQFMEASVRDADTVLCICTPSYVTKANGRASGVGVETSLITPQFYERMSSSKQFIPVVRSIEESIPETPDYLAALIFLDFRDDSQLDTQLEELLRHLYNQPKYRKPTVGVRPAFHDVPSEVQWDGSAYWTVPEDGVKDGPFCQVCYDSSKKLCRLYHGSELDPDYARVTHYYLKCRVCGNAFEDHETQGLADEYAARRLADDDVGS